MAPKPILDPFAQAMSRLRAHLIKCYQCRNAFDHDILSVHCLEGMALSVTVAKACDKLLSVKRRAVTTVNDAVYACPDIAVHGEAFAMTAQPLQVVAIQDELF